MKKVIELRGVTKQFDGETVLDSIDLDIYDNEFLTLLGPSGCGKTTTLRMIGGFETPDQGAARPGGQAAAGADTGSLAGDRGAADLCSVQPISFSPLVKDESCII